MAPLEATHIGTRKTRFVLVSDTHSTYPKLPEGDVLVHASDLTNQGSLSELRKTLEWIAKSDFKVKLVIAGNHDITLDKPFYSQHGRHFHNQHLQDPDECIALVKSFPGITYLHHTSALVRIITPDGLAINFRVFGSPYVPARGLWAFGYDQSVVTAENLWAAIPLDTDIVITHTPPYNHCDASPKWGTAGCEQLRQALWRVRPSLAICGHVHEGRGVERVKWKLDLPYVPFMEAKTTLWSDPGAGNKKLSRVDLTGRGDEAPLANDGGPSGAMFANEVSFSAGDDEGDAAASEDELVTSLAQTVSATPSNASLVSQASQIERGSGYAKEQPISPVVISAGAQDQLSRLHQQNVAALSGRYGRQETCIVNASIMAHSWGQGPRRSNKPIVVDIDLPTWREERIAVHTE